MIKKTLKSLKRAPVRAVAVLLFAAVITMIICALQATNEAELRNYEEVWQSVPITVTVTDPTGKNDGDLLISPWVFSLFTDDTPVKFYDDSAEKKYSDPVEELSLAEYLKDVQSMMYTPISTINGTKYTSAAGTTMLYGITSLSCDKQLLPENGCDITWYEGYDESIFAGEELLCIIPEGMADKYNKDGEADLYFSGRSNIPFIHRDENGKFLWVNGELVVEFPKVEYNCSLKIVGTYTAGDGKSIYCPYPIIDKVYDELRKNKTIRVLSATIADNRRLDEFREKMSYCFLEPSPNAKKTAWGVSVDYGTLPYITEKNYSYALDIDDNNLFDLAAILEESIKFNHTVTVFVVILSTISGFLVGFLMIRRRKRDILLMRTVGESNFRLYIGFVLEQMICIILGIAVGGAYYMWNPVDKLAIFAGVYFVALTIALAVFMNKKLLTTIKEDE